jgi:hypothetical protein
MAPPPGCDVGFFSRLNFSPNLAGFSSQDTAGKRVAAICEMHIVATKLLQIHLTDRALTVK